MELQFDYSKFRENLRNLIDGSGKSLRATAILDERLFYRLKFLLQRNRRGGVAAGQTYVRKNVHIFGGLLRCAKCGSNMTSNQDRRRAGLPSTPAAAGGGTKHPAQTSTSLT